MAIKPGDGQMQNGYNKFLYTAKSDGMVHGMYGVLLATSKNKKRGVILSLNKADPGTWGAMMLVQEISEKEYPVAVRTVMHIPDDFDASPIMDLLPLPVACPAELK